eukprot:IDg14998t1
MALLFAPSSTFLGLSPRTQPLLRPASERPHRVLHRTAPVAKLKVAVAGGGLGGLALASYLVNHNVDVTVFEQARSYK